MGTTMRTTEAGRPRLGLQPGTAPDLSAQRGWRYVKSALMQWLMGLTVILALLPVVFVVITVITKGAHSLFSGFPKFLTANIPNQERKVGPGMGPAVVGTLLITALATVIAVPIGILGAVYLHEYGGDRPFAKVVRFLSNVMTGVPSIVMGLFIYVIFTLRFGYSGLGGALALAFLMLPIIIRSVEVMLKLVPTSLREASYALGTSKSRTVLTVVLPSALPGVISGCLLAVARAAGETAPLLFTIFTVTTTNRNVFSGANTTLSRQIFANALSSLSGAQGRAWGAALTLLVIAFLFTIVARIASARFAAKR
jgi:phosphate transport system permease protein